MDQTHDLGELAPAWRDTSREVDLDEPEFAEIYDEHFGFVRSCLSRLGVPAEALDDACQEVFLVVHRKLREFEYRSTVRTWLYAIARRVASNHHRATRRRERRHAALTEVPVQHEDLEQIVARNEATALLQAFMDQLDDDKREAFMLGELEGMSRREMGEALGINPNTAYTRLQSARKIFDRTFAEGSARDAFIAQARHHDRETTNARQRVWALMLPALPTAEAWTAGSTLTGLSAKVAVFVATVVVGTGIMVGVKAAVRPEPAPPASTERVEAPAMVRTTSPPKAPSPAPAPEVADMPRSPPATEPTPTPSVAPTNATRSSDEDLASELELLDRAAADLAAGRHENALAELRGHERRFPRGQLRAEREVLFVETLCASGRTDQARVRGRRFLRQHASSSLRRRVEASCAISSK